MLNRTLLLLSLLGLVACDQKVEPTEFFLAHEPLGEPFPSSNAGECLEVVFECRLAENEVNLEHFDYVRVEITRRPDQSQYFYNLTHNVRETLSRENTLGDSLGVVERTVTDGSESFRSPSFSLQIPSIVDASQSASLSSTSIVIVDEPLGDLELTCRPAQRTYGGC